MRLKKTHWITLIIIGLLALAILGGKKYLHQRIDKAIKVRLAEAFGENITADFRRSRVGFRDNTLAFESIDVFESHADTENWTGHIELFKIYGFDLIEFVKDGTIGIDSVLILKPDLRIFKISPDSANITPTDTSSIKSSYQLYIQSISLEGGKLTYDPYGPAVFSTEIDFRIADFELDSISNFNENVLNKIQLDLKNLSYQFPDSVYQISLRQLKIHPKNSQIEINDINLLSNLSTEEFSAHFGWRKAKLTLNAPSLIIEKPAILSSEMIAISNISLDSAVLNIDKDNRFPFPNRWTDLPQDGLSRMAQKFKIDSIHCSRGELYINATQENGELANIELLDIEANLIGLQNMDSLLPAFTIEVNSTLMDEASFNLVSTYSYGPNEPFTCNGSLGNTRLEFMDEYLQKTTGLKLVDGVLNRLDFEMTGNEYGTSGFVDFRYDNLQIHAVDKESGKDKKMVNFLSNIAGSLVFWNENPSKNHFRRGSFYVQRDVRKGFMSQWVEGLVQGIVITVSKVDPKKFESEKKESEKKKKKRRKNRKK